MIFIGPVRSMTSRLAVCLMAWCGFLSVSATVSAQRTGQPASDVLVHEDLWGNPTFVGGVTNGGPNATGVA